MAPNLNPEQQARERIDQMLWATDLREKKNCFLVTRGQEASKPASRQARKPMADEPKATCTGSAAERPMAIRPQGHQATSPLA